MCLFGQDQHVIQSFGCVKGNTDGSIGLGHLPRSNESTKVFFFIKHAEESLCTIVGTNVSVDEFFLEDT